jgi:hypothetical protein
VKARISIAKHATFPSVIVPKIAKMEKNTMKKNTCHIRRIRLPTNLFLIE